MTRTRYKKSAETQDRILDAAEELFAKQGYESTTTRQITALAEVRNASVNYYFATKNDLAVAVIDRRFDVLQRARASKLEIAMALAGPIPVRLRHVVEAFVLPLAELSQTDIKGWQNYNRIMAQLAASGEWNQDAYAKKINASALSFIVALEEIFPGAPRTRVVQAYEYMLGSVLLAFAESGRKQALSEGGVSTHSLQQEPEPLICFLCAGLLAMLSSDQQDVTGQRVDRELKR